MSDPTEIELRVAAALCHENGEPWGLQATRDKYIPRARAAIEAMNIPALLTEERTKALSEKEAENARLREALRLIASSGPVDEHGRPNADAGWSFCYDTARAALKAEGGEK